MAIRLADNANSDQTALWNSLIRVCTVAQPRWSNHLVIYDIIEYGSYAIFLEVSNDLTIFFLLFFIFVNLRIDWYLQWIKNDIMTGIPKLYRSRCKMHIAPDVKSYCVDCTVDG